VPFLMGLPHWCVVIAITEGQETLVGVTDVPVAGEHFAARKGHGATLDGARLHIGADRRIDQSLVAVGASERCDARRVSNVIRRLLEAGSMFYRNGSGANMLACVAAGRMGGSAEPAMNPWDSPGGPPHDPRDGGRHASVPRRSGARSDHGRGARSVGRPAPDCGRRAWRTHLAIGVPAGCRH
jgi:myo-inositol-1(or 4)-monophosphatase